MNRRLVIIEGCAASGKTTISNLLHDCFKDLKIDSALISEFSTSAAGILIQQNSQRGGVTPDFLLNIEGVLAYASDKVHIVRKAIENNDSGIFISDRFIDTQFILGVNTCTDSSTKDLVNQIILSLSAYLLGLFDEAIFICLQCPEEVIHERISLRLKRSLTNIERDNLSWEVSSYRDLSVLNHQKDILYVQSDTHPIYLTHELFITIKTRFGLL